MDPLARRVAARFVRVAEEIDKAAADRVCLKEGDGPVQERANAFVQDFKPFADKGGYKWDAILHGIGDMFDDDKMGTELYAEGVYITQQIIPGMLRAIAPGTIVVHHHPEVPGEKSEPEMEKEARSLLFPGDNVDQVGAIAKLIRDRLASCSACVDDGDLRAGEKYAHDVEHMGKLLQLMIRRMDPQNG